MTAPVVAESLLSIAVQVNKLDISEGGNLLVSLHNNKETFPDDWENAVNGYSIPIEEYPEEEENPLENIVFEDLPEGTYAVIVVHDADKNKRMTKNWLGIPKEAFGTSNNPRFFGSPKFKNAKFDLDEDTEVSIDLVTF